MRRTGMHVLKLIGILLFLWILSRIDLTAVATVLANANPLLLLLSFALLFLSYCIKTLRWHALVRLAGGMPRLSDSWRLFHIGIFFGNLTPSNLGELGRAAYLRKQGMHGATAVTLVFIDRLADVIVIALIGIVSIGILFGQRPLEIIILLGLFGFLGLLGFFKKFSPLLRRLLWLQFLRSPRIRAALSTITITSVAAWLCYFAWTITLGRALGIDLPISTFIAILTLTGLVALLPIAPAGLGTRDATLLALMAPFGIAPERAVSMSLMMAVFILVSCVPGMMYWVHGGDRRDQ